MQQASREVIAALDESFFRVRFDRLTPSESATCAPWRSWAPHRSGDIAQVLHKKVTSLAPIRNQLIAKA